MPADGHKLGAVARAVAVFEAVVERGSTVTLGDTRPNSESDSARVKLPQATVHRILHTL
jgi:DNA-binding IclR family transcriptional regulator